MENLLTTPRKISHNILWNFVGTLLPGVLILACIPLAIKNLGDDRFGVLSLAWALLGYLSLLDFGMSRSLIHAVASKIAGKEFGKINSDISTTNVLLIALGSLISLILFASETFWIPFVFKNSVIEIQETTSAVNWMLIGIPLTLSSSGIRGAMEAFGRFDLTNIMRIPLSLATYGLPAVISLYSKNISYGIFLITCARAIGLVAYFLMLQKISPGLKFWKFERAHTKQILSFGGWLAVSNIISPVMTQLDRVMISATIGVGAVTFYSTPIEVLTKLWLVQGGVMSVMFPALTASKSESSEKSAALFRSSLHLILLFVLPATILAILFSQEILSAWISPAFAEKTNLLFKVISVGVLVNAIAQVPFALIQSWGRPDITAKFHMIQLPIYLGCFYWFTDAYGILGAAIVWSGRMILDTAMLSWFARSLARWANTMAYLLVLSGVSVALIFLSLAVGLSVKIFTVLGLAGALVFVLWFSQFFAVEKTFLRKLLKLNQ